MVAGRGLRDLIKECMRVAKHDRSHGGGRHASFPTITTTRRPKTTIARGDDRPIAPGKATSSAPLGPELSGGLFFAQALLHSFPGSAWERPVREALPRRPADQRRLVVR